MLIYSSNTKFGQVDKTSTYSLREDGKMEFTYFGQTYLTSPIRMSYRACEFLLVLTSSGTQYVFVDDHSWSNVVVTHADFSVTKCKNVAIRIIDGKCHIDDKYTHVCFDLGHINEAKFEKDTVTMKCDYGIVSFVPGFYKER